MECRTYKFAANNQNTCAWATSKCMYSIKFILNFNRNNIFIAQQHAKLLRHYAIVYIIFVSVCNSLWCVLKTAKDIIEFFSQPG